VRLASIAEAARAGVPLERCAALLHVAFDGEALSVARVSTDAEDPSPWVHALETLGVLSPHAPPSFEPLPLDARRLLAPRRAELVRLRAAGAAPDRRFVPGSARSRVVEGRCHVVADGAEFLLDDVGGYVFLRVVDDGAPVDQVVDELRRRFVVSRTRIEGDVYDALATWAARGWVGGRMETP